MGLSETGRRMHALQRQLALEYGYKPIEPNLFYGDVREIFKSALPDWCIVGGDSVRHLSTLGGTLLCRGYTRVVIGDYGAFVEIAPDQIVLENIEYKRGQEYRHEDVRFLGHVKYQWLTAKDKTDCKIYFQMLPVSYADYIPGMYYISPYEVMPLSQEV